jgi:hypothetical protein
MGNQPEAVVQKIRDGADFSKNAQMNRPWMCQWERIRTTRVAHFRAKAAKQGGQ